MADKTGPYQVIELHLHDPNEFFTLDETDLVSEYRNYLTGIELAISELRGSFSRRPVRLIVRLPEHKLTAELHDRLGFALVRYCDTRIRYNKQEIAAIRHDGITALGVGLLIAAIGLIAAYVMSRNNESDGVVNFVGDHLGWVLAWVGLWYPLDTIVFTPRTYRRENRELKRLRDAELVLAAWTKS